MAWRDTIDLMMKGKHLILMGCPGSGKGTLAQYLKMRGNYFPFSMGDAMREEIARKTPLGLACQKDFEAGKLVPEEVSHSLFEHHFDRAIQNGQLFIIDGMIQNQNFVDYFDRFIEKRGLDFGFIHLKVDREVACMRIANRLVCTNCRASGVGQNCEGCGAKLVIRCDDLDPQSVAVRLDRFFLGTKPLLDNYKNRSTYLEINADQDLDQLFAYYEKLF